MTNLYFSPCPRGLEPLLAEDVTAAGAGNVKPIAGGVLFSGSLETCYRVNLDSRIATRVLRQVAQGPYQREEDIYHLAREVDWPRLFKVAKTIRVYVTSIKSPLKSLEFITLRVKDAVCDRFRDLGGERPSVDTRNPDVRVHLFITVTDATLYIDTSGEPLYMRGHKIARIEAPIKENLAAGILRLAGWKPGTPLLDPMCGSGTFLLEAAQMSLGDAPGLSRAPGEFGFERLLDFDAALWRRLTVKAAEKRLSPDKLPIWGSDISRDAVARAQQNLAHAGIDDLVELRQADLLTREAPAANGLLIANPPYGERLSDQDEMAAFYPKLGDAFKKRFTGWDCWLISADTKLPKLIGLAPKRKTPLFNGPLECRLYYFPIVAGSNRLK
ncbi:MAG: class I SAM-dependent RNA methyltransferase [Verrucomicrobia bacterium]|nr:MAG: class I SAM-dependent RNA methyltransferase [Verrucomicrobiota bacterium]